MEHFFPSLHTYMKRNISIALILLAICGTTTAAVRDIESAAELANQFIANTHRGMAIAPKTDMRLVHTIPMPRVEQQAAYVFQNGENDGFVIVSADDRAREILGYARAGRFDAEHMPDNLRLWMQHYAEEIAAASTMTDDYSGERSVLSTQSEIAPLLGNIQWNQNEPYNDYCPMDADGTVCYTGCVATAMAQIMRYWKHPLRGTGSNAYTWTNVKGITSQLSADFDTEYDWANMRETYVDGHYSETEINAVSKLMYHIGVASQMAYGGVKAGGSGTPNPYADEAIATYFHYDKSVRILYMDFEGVTAFEQACRAELEARRPVFMSGQTENQEGHAFVCDGVDKNGLFHINWGWSGLSDGYFALTALEPKMQGTGGAASRMGFTVAITASIGIQPDKGGEWTPTSIGATKVVRLSADSCSRNTNITLVVPKLRNLGVRTFFGKVGYVVMQGEQNMGWIYQEDASYFTAASWNPNWEVAARVPSSLTDGQYTIVAAYQREGETEIIPMAVAEGNHTIPFRIRGNILLFDKSAESPVQLNFTQADCFDYSYLGGNRMQIRMKTPGLTYNSYETATAIGTELSLSLRTVSNLSVLGSYIGSSTDTTQAGVIDFSNSYISYDYQVFRLTDGEITIALNPNEDYEVSMHLTDINGRTYQGIATLRAEKVRRSVHRGSKWYESPWDNTTITALSVEQANTVAATGKDELSAIAYLVEGKVAQLTSDNDTIVSLILQDLDSEATIVCSSFRWIEHHLYAADLKVGDHVVLYGRLRGGEHPTLVGCDYQQEPGQEEGMESISTPPLVAKRLINGELIIFCGDQQYNFLGIRH